MYSTINGIKIHYQLINNHSNKTIVFIHGWMDSLEGFQFNTILNTDKFNYLLIDLPGHGKSGKISNYSIDEYSNYVVKLLESLEIYERLFVAHSMGCTVVQKIREKHQLAIYIAPSTGKRNFPALSKFIPLGRILKMKFPQNLWLNWLCRNEGFLSKVSKSISIRNMLACDINVINYGFQDLLRNQFVFDLNIVDKNEYFIIGTKDPISSVVDVTEHLFSDKNLYILKDEKHLLNRTSWTDVNNIISILLNKYNEHTR